MCKIMLCILHSFRIRLQKKTGLYSVNPFFISVASESLAIKIFTTEWQWYQFDILQNIDLKN